MNLENLISILLHETLDFLNKHQDLFELNAKDTEVAFDRASLSAFSREYLLDIDGEQLLFDLANLTKSLYSKTKPSAKNVLSAHISRFLCKLANQTAIGLDKSYAILDREEQISKLNAVFKAENTVMKAYKEFVLANSFEGLISKIRNFAAHNGEFVEVTIQMATDSSAADRRQMVTEFTTKYGDMTLIYFQVNPKLIGGMRIFANGQLTDLSWQKKIETLTKTK
jgi:F0F1-type ATP synthase delta subunit